jgi:hypothetical protein
MSTGIKQALDGFPLSYKVEGKSYGTIECYSDKLKGFPWYENGQDYCILGTSTVLSWFWVFVSTFCK